MQDAWRAYLELAMGLTEAPRKKAQKVTQRLVGSSGATAAQLQALAEELVSTGLANREALTKIIRFEVDRALGAVGLATADEVAELTRRVQELAQELREARAGSGGTAAPTAQAGPADAPSTGVTVSAESTDTTVTENPVTESPLPKKAVAKKAVAKKAVAKKVVAEKPVAERPVAEKAASEKAVAKKAVAKKAVAKKAVAKKTVAKKAVAGQPDTTTGETPSTGDRRRPGTRRQSAPPPESGR